ncbi:hypothetical protein [uncultured Algoriphagus sp.]|uniref:hypothetical protein n=1 Tax=uncultured Algoriphagus sp. TaxID=417365 RepID=UPI002594BD0E|nr:hypothetical protein [uncultured Algoriphagus sp.]
MAGAIGNHRTHRKGGELNIRLGTELEAGELVRRGEGERAGHADRDRKDQVGGTLGIRGVKIAVLITGGRRRAGSAAIGGVHGHCRVLVGLIAMGEDVKLIVPCDQPADVDGEIAIVIVVPHQVERRRVSRAVPAVFLERGAGGIHRHIHAGEHRTIGGQHVRHRHAGGLRSGELVPDRAGVVGNPEAAVGVVADIDIECRGFIRSGRLFVGPAELESVEKIAHLE